MNAQLNTYAKKAGLKYFGSASDIVDVKALDVTYAKILSDKKEFGQITPANGMKVFFSSCLCPYFSIGVGNRM